MHIVFNKSEDAINFARNNSLIAYRGDPAWFVASDEDDAEEIILWYRSRLLYEPCVVGGLHTWARAPERDGTTGPHYWCDECHEEPPSVAIVGVQGLMA